MLDSLLQEVYIYSSLTDCSVVSVSHNLSIFRTSESQANHKVLGLYSCQNLSLIMTYEIHPTAQRPLAPLWGWMFLFLTEIFSGLSLFLASLWATLYLRALYTPRGYRTLSNYFIYFFLKYRHVPLDPEHLYLRKNSLSSIEG